MHQNFLFIINPIAGDLDKSIIFERINNWRKDYNVIIEHYETQGKDDIQKITDKIRDTKPVLIAVGGDGTLKMAAEIAKSLSLIFTQIPAGSANGMARELGIPNINFALPTVARVQLNDLFASFTRCDASSLDAVYINGELMLHIADFGVNANLVKDFWQNEKRGFTGYMKSVVSRLTDLKTFDFTLSGEGQEQKGESVMLAIANAKRYGTGAIINPKGRLDDGYFELISIKDITLKNTLQSLLSILTDEVEYDPRQVKIQKYKRVTVQIDQPVAFQIDGEYLGEIDFAEITIEPQSLRILKPAKPQSSSW